MTSAPERNIRVLVIDDEESIRRALKSILSARKYEVSLAATAAEGIDTAIETNPSWSSRPGAPGYGTTDVQGACLDDRSYPHVFSGKRTGDRLWTRPTTT